MITSVTGDIGAVLGIDEAVFTEDAGRGPEAGEVMADAEDPAGDAKFFVADVDPETGVLDAAEQTIGAGNVTVGCEDVAQDGVGLAAEFAPRGAVKMAVKVVQGLVDEGSAEDARRFAGELRQS